PCREIEGVVDVRTLGAIGVIELAAMRDIAWLKQRFIEQGVWLRPFGDIIYTTPPLTITEAELTRITDAMVATTREWAAR
ncbi:MAG TPA: adenosylmethionine--8-amino-7-oxononanoate aminotransferase BioA, partial [Alphaproteobacteria bacterium]|nr:adenosylmethionine--8-amino-7-oxononanoate aminotransferase BioA [Alphaproteobacteria bacterium]HCO91652.1 adenosylmethionine--8-amino-7-oxononanoate aminotransferase BioA [Alphaproteobacteria bacterium]